MLGAKQITLNTTTENKHVGDIEWLICTIKERIRCICALLPFTRIPGRLIVELCYATVFWLNEFHPCQNPINNMNPRTLLTGQKVDYNKHCHFEFGNYVQTHELTNSTMRPRTLGVIALRPSGNVQGGYFFLSLLTGRRLHRHQVTPLPMPDNAITRVIELAARNPEGLHFRNRNNKPFPAHYFDPPDDPDTPDGAEDVGRSFLPNHAPISHDRNDMDSPNNGNHENLPVDTSKVPCNTIPIPLAGVTKYAPHVDATKNYAQNAPPPMLKQLTKFRKMRPRRR